MIDPPFESLDVFEQQRAILNVLKLLSPCSAFNYKKIRVGSPGDGGYVQLDDFDNITHAFSIGISDNDSWDLDIAKRGIPVEQYDHSIDRAPSDHPLLKFHKKKLAPAEQEGTVTLPRLVSDFSRHGYPHLLLNIDIEGDEWDVFDGATSEDLEKFAQIVGEFHRLEKISDSKSFPKMKRVIAKLSEQFGVVHVHGNNCCGFASVHNIALPRIIELTFANRGKYSLKPSGEIFPTVLDFPNVSSDPDIWLGAFVF